MMELLCELVDEIDVVVELMDVVDFGVVDGKFGIVGVLGVSKEFVQELGVVKEPEVVV